MRSIYDASTLSLPGRFITSCKKCLVSALTKILFLPLRPAAAAADAESENEESASVLIIAHYPAAGRGES